MSLPEDPDLQPLFFGLFLCMYLVTVLRILFIILAVMSESHLCTPMYFFLAEAMCEMHCGFEAHGWDPSSSMFEISGRSQDRVVSGISFTNMAETRLRSTIQWERVQPVRTGLPDHGHRASQENPGRLSHQQAKQPFLFPVLQKESLAHGLFLCEGCLLICFFSLTLFIKRCLSYIDGQNLTDVSEFQLLSLSEDPDLQPILFGLFLSMYLVTVLGNLLIILAISSDPHLHTPMYFFLSNLSLADICFISTTVPKMIVDIQTHSRAISYVGCLTQMSLFTIFACMDYMLLTVMAYDRFVAICHPLHYLVMMNPRLCGFLTFLSFLFSLLECQLHILMMLQITNFKDMEIASFFCDPSQLLNLSCSNTFYNNLVKYFLGAVYGLFPISGILFSYYKIVSTILRIPSSGGRYKAFSTCGSHLAVVGLFIGTGFGGYLGSAASHSPRKGAVASVMYTVVTPMLNPFIYGLRNSDIKSVLRRWQKQQKCLV
ncbi:olfactory receptor 7E24-like [Urocitellus parryii]